MNKKVESQVANAIKWIDELPNYKQAPKGERSKLGNAELGYCCIGAGCAITQTPFHFSDGLSNDFKYVVGLKGISGNLYERFDDADVPISWYEFFGKHSLTAINDETNAGFKRIARLLKNHPEWMFKKAVAEGIRAHYAKKEKGGES